MIYLLFVLATILGLGLAYLAWRYWEDQVRRTPEDEEFDARVADLNQSQANRLSDDQIRSMLDTDDAWQRMVNRGQQARQRRPRKRQETRDKS